MNLKLVGLTLAVLITVGSAKIDPKNLKCLGMFLKK